MKNLTMNGAMAAISLAAATLSWAAPLSEEEIAELGAEARFRVEQFRYSLRRVYKLGGREALLHRMIGFVVLSDVTVARNAAEILSSPGFRTLIPSSDTRMYGESKWLYGKMQLDTLILIATPSKRMEALLYRAQEGVVREYPELSDEDCALVLTLGPLTAMYLLARADGSLALPEFSGENRGLVRYCPTDIPARDAEGAPNRAFFERWYRKIRYAFVETEAESHLAHTLSEMLSRIGLDACMEIFSRDSYSKKGPLSLTLDILARRAASNPELTEKVNELRRRTGIPADE